MMPKIVTANELATGLVVFLGRDEAWVKSVERALVYPDAAAAEDGLAIGLRDAAKAIIVDPFVVERDPDAGDTGGMTMRDRIRAFGPTIRYLAGGGSPHEDSARG